MDRAAWTEGLDVPLMSDKPEAQVLYWVGCAASYDDPRAKKIARAAAKLLKQAGVDFAILGTEETCTGDPARRAGNEFLFAMLAEENAADAQRVQREGRHEDGRDDVPALLQHAEERVPGLRGQARSRAPHGLLARAPRREEARAAEPGARARDVSRQLLPRSLQRRLRFAARDPEAHPRRRARRARVLDEATRPLLRRGRRADVHGGAEQESREREAHAAARRHAARRRSPARARSA